jgi:hypothetical protein
MVLLLVVGLAAVIAVILIAVILSVRLGRHHDDEELEDRPSERGHGREDAGDPRRRDTRTPRTRPQAQDRRYRDRDDRPERDQVGRPEDDYDYPQRRPSRRAAAPAGSPSGSRRPSGAGARQPGTGRDGGGRRNGSGRDRHEATPAPYDAGTSLYDTGTSPRLAADDFPSEPLHAADFPSAEFASRPQPADDFPSGEFASAVHPADAPTARYRAADPGSGEFPSGPLPAADFASGEFPAADFASAEFPAADFPSEEMPAASTRGRPAPSKTDAGRGRTDSRRRPASGREAKGRSRQSRKRDDDDWPSMEWDKLTDEQYWAELSSDKPLATTARSAKPAGEPAPAARNGQPRAAAAKPKPAAPQPASAPGGRTRARDVPGRASRPSSPREPAPVREAAPMREPATARPPATLEREPATLEREAVSAREPAAHFAQQPVARDYDAVTERLPGRPRPQPAARHRGDPPPAARPDTIATPPAGEPSLAMLASLGTGPNMMPDDDPLTSPSFARPAMDSRSYRTARNSTQPGDTANGAHLDGPPDYGNGYGSNGYPAADHGGAAYVSSGGTHDHAQANGTYQPPSYDDPGHGYIPAAPAATATPPAGALRPDDRYSAPKHSPSQGNPYGSFVEPAPMASYPSIPPAGYQGQQPGAAFPAYPDEHDGYQEPVYDAAAQMYPAPVAAAAARPTGPAPYPSGGGQFPEPAAYPAAGYQEGNGYGNGYADQPAYADGYGNGNGGYPPGYPAAAYAADQYGQDEYDGYPADQG